MLFSGLRGQNFGKDEGMKKGGLPSLNGSVLFDTDSFMPDGNDGAGDKD